MLYRVIHQACTLHIPIFFFIYEFVQILIFVICKYVPILNDYNKIKYLYFSNDLRNGLYSLTPSTSFLKMKNFLFSYVNCKQMTFENVDVSKSKFE